MTGFLSIFIICLYSNSKRNFIFLKSSLSKMTIFTERDVKIQSDVIFKNQFSMISSIITIKNLIKRYKRIFMWRTIASIVVNHSAFYIESFVVCMFWPDDIYILKIDFMRLLTDQLIMRLWVLGHQDIQNKISMNFDINSEKWYLIVVSFEFNEKGCWSWENVDF